MKKTRKGYTLVSANGRVMHKRIEDFKAQIMASNRSKSLKDELINELDAFVNDRRLRVKKLTETGMLKMLFIIKEVVANKLLEQ